MLVLYDKISPARNRHLFILVVDAKNKNNQIQLNPTKTGIPIYYILLLYISICMDTYIYCRGIIGNSKTARGRRKIMNYIILLSITHLPFFFYMYFL